ncbi:MAG: hypothetical protein ACYCVN_08755 [Acidimicrobiales bacterium]
MTAEANTTDLLGDRALWIVAALGPLLPRGEYQSEGVPFIVPLRVDCVWNDIDSLPALGVAQYGDQAEPPITGQRLFTFLC